MWSWGRLGVCGFSWVSKWWHLHQIEAPIRISVKRMLRRKKELRRLPALMNYWSLLKGRGITAQVVVVEGSVGRDSCSESPDPSQASFTPSLYAVMREKSVSAEPLHSHPEPTCMHFFLVCMVHYVHGHLQPHTPLLLFLYPLILKIIAPNPVFVDILLSFWFSNNTNSLIFHP